MIEFKRQLPANVQNPQAGYDVLFLDDQGNYYTKDSAGISTLLGNGIANIVKIGTIGLVDTYRITYESGETFDYTVTNARSIVDVIPPANPGQPGATDTYQIDFNDGPNDTFIVYNGTNGLDGQGQPAVNNPTSIDPDDAASIGTRTAFYALEDHQHAIVAASAVGLNGGSANTEGTAASFARSDHTHAIANGGTPSTTSNVAAAQGVSTSLARADHVHAVASAAAVGLNGGSVNGAGTATTLALSDHTHAIANGGTPSTITPDAAANQGAATSLARSDHVHAIVADVPVALGAAASEGTSTSFARADHVHLNPVIAHEAAADPHPQYTTTAEAAAAAPVQSFNGRTGSITPQQADYDAFFTTPAEAAAAAPVQSVNGQTGNVTIATSLQSATATLGANVTLPTSNAQVALVSVSLAAGTWLITAGATFTRTATTAGKFSIMIGPNATVENAYASATIDHPSLANVFVACTVSALVTIGATTTVTLYGAHSAGATSNIVRALNSQNAAGATKINAIKVA